MLNKPPVVLAFVWVFRHAAGARDFGRWSCAGAERRLAMLTTFRPERLSRPITQSVASARWSMRCWPSSTMSSQRMYWETGWPSVPPEQVLKATVLMALYSIRSKRSASGSATTCCSSGLDLPIDAAAFDPTTFTKNRERLLGHEIADRFFAAVVREAKLRAATSRASTSRWMARCLRPGRRTRASSPRTALGRAVSGGRNAETSRRAARVTRASLPDHEPGQANAAVESNAHPTSITPPQPPRHPKGSISASC
jgi:hypothetical protein